MCTNLQYSKAMSGIVITAFEPRTPAIFPDPDSVIKACMDSKSDIIFCVPSFVEVSLPRLAKKLPNSDILVNLALVSEARKCRVLEKYFRHREWLFVILR